MLGKASAWNHRCCPCCLPRAGKQARKREWKAIERKLWMREAQEDMNDADLEEELRFWDSLKDAISAAKEMD